jgi:hypothetical protein
MPTVEQAYDEVVAELKNLKPAVRVVYDDPPEDVDTRFPFLVVYFGSGEFQKQTRGFMVDLHSIVIELHTQRLDLPRDFREIVGIFDQIPLQLELGLEEGRFEAIQTWETITYDGTDPMAYGDLQTLGVTFTMQNVKILNTVST